MAIDELFEKNKGKLRMLGIFALVFSLGFGCGYYYLDAQKIEKGVAVEDKSAEYAALFEKGADHAGASASATADVPASDSSGTVLSGSTVADKRFAGSKNSTLYHTPDCQYVKRIKDENVVWFGSAAEAEAAGKKPHGCVSG